MSRYQKIVTTLAVCFYYLYFLAACEAMIWLEQSGTIVLTFTGIHIAIKFFQWTDYGSSRDAKLYPYRNLSVGFRNALITADTLVTFIVFLGYLYIQNTDEETQDMFKYLLCFFSLIIAIVNVVKHHIRQVESSNVNSASRFTQDFGDV